MASFLRLVLNFVVAGALLGVLAVTLLYPGFQTWYASPGAGKALCECAETARQAAEGLINAQMIGCATGAGLGLAGGLAFATARRRRQKALASATVPTPAPAPVASPTRQG